MFSDEREQLEEVSRNTRSTGYKMLVIVWSVDDKDDDDNNVAIVGSKAYLFFLAHRTISSFINAEKECRTLSAIHRLARRKRSMNLFVINKM